MLTFTRIGFLSFGGPVGQIALMQHELVDERLEEKLALVGAEVERVGED